MQKLSHNSTSNPFRFLVFVIALLGTTTSMLVAPVVAAETSSLSIQVFPDFLSEDELAYLSHVDAFISLEGMSHLYK